MCEHRRVDRPFNLGQYSLFVYTPRRFSPFHPYHGHKHPPPLHMLTAPIPTNLSFIPFSKGNAPPLPGLPIVLPFPLFSTSASTSLSLWVVPALVCSWSEGMPEAAVDWVRVVKGVKGVFSRRGAVFAWRDFGPVRFLGVLMGPKNAKKREHSEQGDTKLECESLGDILMFMKCVLWPIEGSIPPYELNLLQTFNLNLRMLLFTLNHKSSMVQLMVQFLLLTPPLPINTHH